MDNFELAFQYMLKNECKGNEVTNNPNDAGGITKYGISLRFLRSIKIDTLNKLKIYTVDADAIINLSIDQAKEIYRTEFYNHASFDSLIDTANRNYIFDMAVNCGIAQSIKIAQRACWAVILQSRQTLLDDGRMGNETICRINQSGPFLLPVLRSERAWYYRLIVEKNPAQQEFLEGWLNRTYGA